MLVLVLSLHTFVRMPEIAKKKKKNATPHIFTAVFERTVRRTVLEYEQVGLKAWFLLNTRIIRKQRVKEYMSLTNLRRLYTCVYFYLKLYI